MSSIIVETLPLAEPLTLAEVKLALGLGPWEDSDHVTSSMQAQRLRGLISAAREYCEVFTRRSFVTKGYVQYLDAFPYYFSDPPSSWGSPWYGSFPPVDYWQMIKLFYSPLVAVSKISYIGSDNASHDLAPVTDFVIDTANEPPRVFPKPGQLWPTTLYAPNAVAIHFTAGYGNDATNVPNTVKVAMRILVGLLDKDPGLIAKGVPIVDRLLWSQRVEDWAPTAA